MPSGEIRAKWTFPPDSTQYIIWFVIKTIACLVSTIQYPIIMVTSFPELLSPWFIVMCVCEFIFLIDTILNFFKQELDEAGEPEQDPIDEVAYKYLVTNFPFDFVALLPLGFLGSLLDHRLEFLWIFKS